MNSSINFKLFLVVIVLFCYAQLSIAEEPFDTESEGKIQFIDNCSLCHGEDARVFGTLHKLRRKSCLSNSPYL